MNKKAFIIGNGPSAHHLAKELLASGADVVLATSDETTNILSTPDYSALEILTNTQGFSCQGVAGNFKLTALCDGKKVTRNVAEIIIAEEDRRQPNFSLYGLRATSNVVSQSSMKTLLLESSHEKKLLSEVKTVVFLLGFIKESNPVITKEIMNLAVSLQTGYNLQTYILTKNLKVADDGLEALYRETKDAGSVVIKFTNSIPAVHQDKDNDVWIEFVDEITSGKYRLSPDLTVVDETIVASDYIAELAKVFRLDTDLHGFVQADNVHRLSVFTNRKGILASGPSRSIQSRHDQIMDAENVLLQSVGQMAVQRQTPTARAEVDTGQCIRCLTCYRLCPYRAITINPRVTVVPEICERCGICAAQCPRGAVGIQDLEPDSVLKGIGSSKPIHAEEAFQPSLVAFCCSRSSARAGDLAQCMRHELPLGLNIIEVPCAGSISLDHIFKAFQSHADGVLVVTCHKGNCHSEQGNIFAAQSVEQVKEMFGHIGFEADRLLLQTLASNMGSEFADMMNSFEETVVKLGPSRLKKHQ